MKKISLLFLLVNNFVWCQNTNVSGIIRDSQTMQPIALVNIYYETDANANSTGTVSNDDGEFTINNSKSKLVFSHINYEPFSIKSNENLKEILLKPKNYVLDEIVVSNESAKDYLKRIIKLSNNKIDKNTLLKGYCRELVKVDNQYTKYSDALVEYYVKKGNGKSNLVLTQHRALKSDKIDDEDDNKVDGINSVYKVKDYVKNAYKFDAINRLLNDDDYDFERKIKKEANGEEYEYVSIIPNENSDRLLNKGYIIIDPKSKNILEFKVYSSESHLKNSRIINILIAKVKMTHELTWSKFKMVNNQYLLIYNKKQFGLYIKMGKKIDNTFDFSSDLFIYEYQNNVDITKNEYTKNTIYQSGTSSTEEFWKKYNAFPLSENEQKFVDATEKNRL